MDPSATATRRTRLALALTLGGAVVLMAGVSLMLIGEVARLEQAAGGLKQVISLGAMLAAAGLILGLLCVIVVITGLRVAVRSVSPGSVRPGYGPVQPSGSARSSGDAAIRPVSAAARGAAAASAGPVGPGQAGAPGGQAGDDYLDAHYSDEGWRLDGTGPMPAQRPADPPQEIHHPVRPMTAPRPPGQPLGADSGQHPAS